MTKRLCDYNPLSAASAKGNVAIVELLLGHLNAEISHASLDSQTIASASMHTPMVGGGGATISGSSIATDARVLVTELVHQRIIHACHETPTLPAPNTVNVGLDTGSTHDYGGGEHPSGTAPRAQILTERLIQAKADLTSSLKVAVESGQDKIVCLLLRVKAGVEGTSAHARELLPAAARINHLPIVKLLVKAKCSVNDMSSSGATPM